MTIGSFIKEKWPELVIMLLLSTLCYTVFFDIRDRLTKTEVSSQDTKDRLDRIAQALPDMAVRVASEYKYQSIQSAMIVSSPKLAEAGWVSEVSIFNSALDKVEVLNYPLADQSDQRAILAIRGALTKLDNGAVSFDLMQKAKEQGYVGATISEPKKVGWSSFVYVSDPSELEKQLIGVGASKMKTMDFQPRAYTWDEFAAGVNDGSIPLGWTN